MDENWRYEVNQKLGLSRGQIIVLGTDGIWEARNNQGEMFGKASFNEIIRQNAARSAAEIVAAVFKATAALIPDSLDIACHVVYAALGIIHNLTQSTFSWDPACCGLSAAVLTIVGTGIIFQCCGRQSSVGVLVHQKRKAANAAQ